MPEEDIIPSNFDENDWINSTTAPSNVACSPWPRDDNPENEIEGKLRVNCFHSHVEYSDPILYFGQPGAAHLHMFFGNTLTNHSSTYDSLRTTGSGTCSGGPINRTGYWHPAMIRPQSNQIVIPTSYTVYYTVSQTHRSRSGLFPPAGVSNAAATDFPRGFAFIGGWPDIKPTMQSINDQNESVPHGVWFFDDAVDAGPPPYNDGTLRGSYSGTIAQAISFAQASPGGGAAAGSKFIMRMTMPECWDGVNLKSSNGRTHVAYHRQDGNSVVACPSTHAFPLPEILVAINYDHEGAADVGQWFISSDMGHGPPTGSFPAGHTMHIDWYGAWSQAITDIWALGVLGIGGASSFATSCNNGNLGNNTALIESHFPSYTASQFLPEANRYMAIPASPSDQATFFGFPQLSLRA